MKQIIFLIISLILIATSNGIDFEEAEPVAKLLVSKQIMNKFIVENMDLVVKYTIYNIGNGPAFDVKLVDEIPPYLFELVAGDYNIVIDRLAPQTNVTHAVVLRPVIPGLFNFSAAKIEYKSSKSSASAFSFTSAPGQWYVVSYVDYVKKFSSHLLDWATFAVIALTCILAPFMMWYTSKSKYELISKQKKDKSAKE